MCRKTTPFNNIFILVAIFTLIAPNFTFAFDLVSDIPVTISAVVNAPVVDNGGGNGGGGGGGGSGGGGGITMPTAVNFSGMAYPLSKVYILKDGNIVATTIADQAANFYVSLTGLTTNTYTFSVYGEDSKNRKSSFFSFPIYITEGTTVNIGNIYLSPTIDVDKAEVKKGDNLLIFGQSIPDKEVVISVHSDPEYFFKVMSNTMGAYLYNLDTSVLLLGKHQTKSKNTLTNQLSLYATPVSFLVGEENETKKYISCSLLRGDLNCDNHVNLIDFSIMAYWYKRSNPPAKVDLSGDGKITLTDFSILAYNWTG